MTAALPPPITILIVEDNRIDAHLTSHALRKIKDWPVAIELVDDGDKAIRFLRRQDGYPDAPTPDLVILDMNLPKRDGTEVLQAIRGSESLRGMLVYIFSSSPVDLARERTKDGKVEADCYFEKPYGVGSYQSIAAQMKENYLAATSGRRVANA